MPHTHLECQAVHKTHDFEWNTPTMPDWASRFVRKTHSQHCELRLCHPVTLVSVSTLLIKQQGRKRGEENCRPKVRGHVISRDLANRKRKIGWKFCRIGCNTIMGLFIEGCGSLTLKPVKNAGLVMKEKNRVVGICQHLWTARETTEKDMREISVNNLLGLNVMMLSLAHKCDRLCRDEVCW